MQVFATALIPADQYLTEDMTMKTALTERETAELKTQLLARRDELREELLAEYNKEEEESGHEVRHGRDEYLDKLFKDVDMGISDLRVQEIRAIDAALQRIAVGRYGICLDCGEPIGYQRLLAFPVAKLCYECKEIYERQTKE
jgi:RNA polymerase-binding transcription factor